MQTEWKTQCYLQNYSIYTHFHKSYLLLVSFVTLMSFENKYDKHLQIKFSGVARMFGARGQLSPPSLFFYLPFLLFSLSVRDPYSS